jgi:hypothetical protein
MRKFMAALGIVALVFTLAAVLVSPATTGNRVLAADNRPVVTATGQPGAVKLEWTETALTGIAGYQIRRGPASGEEDRWPLNDFPVVGSTYVDRNVTPGTTYFYTVFPVHSDGTWGFGSFEVSATVGEIPSGYRLAQFHMDIAEATLLTASGTLTVALHGRPIIDRGRVLLPLEDISTLTGAKLSYDRESGRISHTLPFGRQMQMEVGKCAVTFSKAERQDICSPVERDGLVYLPLRWVVEAMEGTLTFDTLGDRVTIEILPAVE